MVGIVGTKTSGTICTASTDTRATIITDASVAGAGAGTANADMTNVSAVGIADKCKRATKGTGLWNNKVSGTCPAVSAAIIMASIASVAEVAEKLIYDGSVALKREKVPILEGIGGGKAGS